MAFIVVYDANVLVGNTQRDLMVRIAQTPLVQAKWTDRILDEAIAAVLKTRPDILPERLARTRALMIDAAPDCLVSGHEPLIDGLHLRDPDDRHVLAAAIKSGAQVIVTADKDFTAADLAPWNIEAKDSAKDTSDAAATRAATAVRAARRAVPRMPVIAHPRVMPR